MAWIPFEYRDFWEVPRLIVCMIGGTEYMLDSEFDEAANTYAPRYRVYRLPPIPDPDAPAPPIEEDPVFLGSIPVAEVRFDPTLRAMMEDAPLRALAGG